MFRTNPLFGIRIATLSIKRKKYARIKVQKNQFVFEKRCIPSIFYCAFQLNRNCTMLTTQLRLVVIIGLVTLSKVAFSKPDHDHSKHNHDSHSAMDGIQQRPQGPLIQQLYKDYFEWKYTVWSPEAGKIKICPVLQLPCDNLSITIVPFVSIFRSG